MERRFDQKQMKIRIKELKKKRDFTNEQLSIESGIPLGTLNNFLGSAVKEPKLNTVIALAETLHVSTDYLIFGEDIRLSREAILIAEQYEKADERAKASIKVALEYLDETVDTKIKGAERSSTLQKEKEA